MTVQKKGGIRKEHAWMTSGNKEKYGVIKNTPKHYSTGAILQRPGMGPNKESPSLRRDFCVGGKDLGWVNKRRH